MVKVAIAGASGQVALEIIDALITSGKHELLLISRKDVSGLTSKPNSKWIQVDYSNKDQLSDVLRGVDTLLSFITSQTDLNCEAQKNLIDASIIAEVKRFAPSEWATSKVDHMPWYNGKAEIRDYLASINKEHAVLPYCLFQPGLFVNYFTHPYKSANHVSTFQTQIDFENRRAIVPEGYESVYITLTAAKDLADVVVQALEVDVWPVTGGIQGCDITLAQLIQLGETVRGGPFTIDVLSMDDLRAGRIKSSWVPKVEHAAIPPEQAEALAGMFLTGMTLGMSAGALKVTDEWNQLLPSHQFIQPREFLTQAWQGKP